MKKFTFIFVGLLFLVVQGISADDLNAFDGDCNIGIGPENPVLVFYNNNPKSSRAGGENWVAPLPSGKKHVFTINVTTNGVNSHDTKVDELHIVALNALLDNTYGRVNESNFDGTNFKSSVIVAENYISIPDDGNNHELSIEVSETYNIVFLYSTRSGKIKINSFTRTEENAGTSVAAPTISPASSTYDGDLSVTITKGDGNDRVVYSVSGADGGDINATFTAEELANGFKVLDLTGTETITVRATGYKGENASSAVVNTYNFHVPNGKKTITSNLLPHTFNSWDPGNALQFNQSEFSGMSLNDYVVLNVQDVAKDATFLGFRCNNNGWPESPFVGCTTVSRGNGAYGVINKGETLWWLKASNDDVVNEFTGHGVIMQGGMLDNNINSSVTLNSIDIYKSFTVSEGVDNTISSKEDHVVVELTRSFVKDTWNTVCLPFALTSAQADKLFGEGYQLAEFTDVSGTTMKFTTAASFKAGVPYLVKPTINVSDASPVVLVDVNITAKTPQTVPHGDYSFVGNFTKKKFTSSDYATSRFVATGNELVTPNENSILKSLRCYFTVPATPVTPARSLTFDVDEEGGTTSINTVQGSGVMVNGYYNLAGQRVAQPTKGLYIVNGKKVVIK